MQIKKWQLIVDGGVLYFEVVVIIISQVGLLENIGNNFLVDCYFANYIAYQVKQTTAPFIKLFAHDNIIKIVSTCWNQTNKMSLRAN